MMDQASSTPWISLVGGMLTRLAALRISFNRRMCRLQRSQRHVQLVGG
jgi:hypothetical protein